MKEGIQGRAQQNFSSENTDIPEEKMILSSFQEKAFCSEIFKKESVAVRRYKTNQFFLAQLPQTVVRGLLLAQITRESIQGFVTNDAC